MDKMIATALKLSTSELKTQATKMANATEDWAGDVLAALLGALEQRMPEDEFVAFCNSI